MSVFNLFDSYEEAWKAVIQPPKHEYELSDLGPQQFNIRNHRIIRSDFHLTNRKGVRLECSFFEHLQVEKTLPCVIYCHGNGCSRVESLHPKDMILGTQVNYFTFDFTASGKSGGEYSTVGWHEKDDIDCVIEFLTKEKKVDHIALWGRSMGAIAAIFYANQNPKVRCLILDSAFSNFEKLIKEVAQSKVYVPGFLISGALTFLEKTINEKASFKIGEVNPIKAIQSITLPILFGSGNNDKLVSCKHTEDLYNACKKGKHGGNKVLKIFEGEHNSQRPVSWMGATISFLKQHLLGTNVKMQSTEVKKIQPAPKGNIDSRSRSNLNQRLLNTSLLGNEQPKNLNSSVVEKESTPTNIKLGSKAYNQHKHSCLDFGALNNEKNSLKYQPYVKKMSQEYDSQKSETPTNYKTQIDKANFSSAAESTQPCRQFDIYPNSTHQSTAVTETTINLLTRNFQTEFDMAKKGGIQSTSQPPQRDPETCNTLDDHETSFDMDPDQLNERTTAIGAGTKKLEKLISPSALVRNMPLKKPPEQFPVKSFASYMEEHYNDTEICQTYQSPTNIVLPTKQNVQQTKKSNSPTLKKKSSNSPLLRKVIKNSPVSPVVKKKCEKIQSPLSKIIEKQKAVSSLRINKTPKKTSDLTHESCNSGENSPTLITEIRSPVEKKIRGMTKKKTFNDVENKSKANLNRSATAKNFISDGNPRNRPPIIKCIRIQEASVESSSSNKNHQQPVIKPTSSPIKFTDTRTKTPSKRTPAKRVSPLKKDFPDSPLRLSTKTSIPNETKIANIPSLNSKIIQDYNKFKNHGKAPLSLSQCGPSTSSNNTHSQSQKSLIENKNQFKKSAIANHNVKRSGLRNNTYLAASQYLHQRSGSSSNLNFGSINNSQEYNLLNLRGYKLADHASDALKISSTSNSNNKSYSSFQVYPNFKSSDSKQYLANQK